MVQKTVEEEISKSTVSNPCKNVNVEFKLVERDGGWLSDISKNHDGKTLFSSAKITFIGLPYNNATNNLVDPLTEEEREFFESKKAGLNLKQGDLSIYNKDCYWNSYQADLTKDGLKMNVGNPVNYLKYKYLLAQGNIIAKTWEERFDKATYKFALVSETHDVEIYNAKLEILDEVYSQFRDMKNDSSRMKNILKLYGKNVQADASLEFLRMEIQKLIEKDPAKVLDTCKDKDFDLKVFIEKAIEIGELRKVARGNYGLPEGDSIGTIQDTITYFKAKANTDIKLKIQTRIDASVK